MLPFRVPRHAACATRALDGRWLDAVSALESEPFFWWLDSALPGPRGRFSYAGADPWLVARVDGVDGVDGAERTAEPTLELRLRRPYGGAEPGEYRVGADPLDAFRALLAAPRAVSGTPEGLPFVGGAVGWLGYELATHWLPVAGRRGDEPEAALLFVDGLLAHDARDDRAVAIGLGFDEDATRAARRASERAEALAKRVAERTRSRAAPAGGPPVRAEGPRSVLDAAAHAERVRRAQHRIAEGDAYQVCLTHRVEAAHPGDATALYHRLRAANPAPFGALLRLPGIAVLSSSPERLLELDAEGRVESRPIKGTRPRGRTPEQDEALARELAASEKDRAENLMIVDLVRNDLGRVCETGSVHVPELMAIERYARVLQMVSTVRGRLRGDRDVFDLVRALFPAGSMTGAPKIAAMRILEALEPVPRGVYSGALGYFDLRGGASLSVVIRTLVLREGRARLGVGGGIVADSRPEAEWQESWDKAAALLEALGVEPAS